MEEAEEGEADSRMMAGNSMLPTKARMRYWKAAELRGAIRDAASTVTQDHLGEETSDTRGIQWRVVVKIGSGGGAVGVTWRKT